jgi:hypothetical protein
VVVPAREVTFALRLQLADALRTGHGSSPPDGEGISFDRATIPVTGTDAKATAPDDLVLYAMSPGCQVDAAEITTCDRDVRLRLAVHHVTPGAASIALDDARAQLAVAVALPASVVPCPPKNGVSPGGCSVTAAAPFAAYTGIRGQLTLAHLAEDCTDVIGACALSADGTFDLTGTSAAGDTVELASGALSAADTLSYQDGNSCNQ